MAESTKFRCYYDDGTIITVDVGENYTGQVNACPLENDNGSPLLKSELAIIEDVNNSIGFPWVLIILGLVLFMSKERN